MLKAVDVLQEICREKDPEVAQLARRFAVSPGAVRRMLAFLQEHAYLEEVESACSDSGWGCRFCPMKTHCGAGNELFELKIYRLTEKGERLIEDAQRKEGK